MAIADLPFNSVYSGVHLSARWRGHEVVDENRFKSYMARRVKARVEDDEVADPFAAELLGMATTGMSGEFVEKLLRAVPDAKPWAIGEALAECLLSVPSLTKVATDSHSK